MATYRYRAATATGQLRTGLLEGNSRADALERLKRLGLMPIEAVETAGKAAAEVRIKVNSAMRQGVANALGELAVLLNAGLSLDRALQVCVENITRPPSLKTVFGKLRDKVRHGSALSRAMMDSDGVFPPMASAMAEAGEASGKLDESLGRLAETLDRAEALRQTIISSLVYPALLLVVATGVILVMLLFVVPQFEDLFSDTPGAKLPFMTQVVMGASHVVRSYGLIGALALVLGGVAFYRWLHRPHIRRAFHRRLLEVPALGKVIRNAETARFARTLGSLLDGGVALPTALGIAQRSIGNVHMSESIDRVT